MFIKISHLLAYIFKERILTYMKCRLNKLQLQKKIIKQYLQQSKMNFRKM